MNPSMVVALLLGGWMLYLSPAWLSQGWMHAKLTLVALLVVYHHMCGRIRKRFAEDANTRSHVYYRWFNEAPVLALVGIVILVIIIRQLDQPWRGIVDAGVVIGLVWGALSIVVMFVRAVVWGIVPPNDSLPDESS